MNPTGSKLLFVYGTLKRGCSNHPFLSGQKFINHGRTAPGYRLYDLGDYPGMVRLPEDRDGVRGEIWAVDDACLAEIDFLEGVDQGLYRRERIELRAPFDDQPVETYVYALSVHGYTDLGSEWIE